MPRLNTELKAACGIGTQLLSYEDTYMTWNPHPNSDSNYRELDGKIIEGGGGVWVDNQRILFQACNFGDCRLYTYDIITGNSIEVSPYGSNWSVGGGGVWACRLSASPEVPGSGYRDSLGRTHPDYFPSAVDDDGTVLVCLENATATGLGYLTKTDNINNPTIITYDQLDRPSQLRNGVVIYAANGVLNRYVIATGETSVTNVPLLLGRTDGNWALGFHLNGLDLVAWEFGKLYGYQVAVGDKNFNGDIRVSDEGLLTVVTSYGQGEKLGDLRRYTINPATSTQYYLFSDRNKTYTLQPGTGPQNEGEPVIGSDVITIGRNPGGNEQGFAKVISSKEWFPDGGGHYIRGAWQYGITAVVTQVGDTGSDHAFAKDSFGHTWDAGENAHGIHCVAIRPAPGTTSSAPLWEITWVRAGGFEYAQAILDADFVEQSRDHYSFMPEGTSQGMLDLDENGVPIATDEHRYEWYGYIKIGLAITRGDWTIGQDVSPTCPVDRLVAWNSATQQAYVVWNGYTNIQSRLALEYDISGNPYPVVVPAGRTFKIVGDGGASQFLPLGQIDLETRKAPGLPGQPPIPPATPSPGGAGGGTTPTPAELKTNTRVFRQPQSIPPTAKVLMAAAKSTSTTTTSLAAAVAAGGPVAATLFGSGAKSMEEDAPSYNPQYPYNTVLVESESGHLIEVDDTPNAERVHIYHRSGSHIEMRPDGGVKYKTVKKRQDITIGDHDLYVAGDWNIVVEGGYTLHVRGGELVIDAKDGAAFNVKGKLKISADDVEMKATKSIFLNSPKVDIGGMSPGGMPFMSIPTSIVPYPAPSLPPIFVPTVKMPISTGAGQKLMYDLTKQVKDGKVSPTAAQSKMAAILANNAVDATGEPAFSKLTEQPVELPLSNPKLYSSVATLAAAGAPATSAIVYAKLRGRAFDTPEDVGAEGYSTHNNLSVELGDYSATAKTSPGVATQSDETPPAPEPHPPHAFNLSSGGTVRCTTTSTRITGTNTKFTEDLEPGLTITVGGTNAVIQSIESDTSLILTAPWPAGTQSGTLQVYRLRPIQEFFNTFTYSDERELGRSGLRLKDMMVNFTSPVIEVPQLNTALLQGGTTSGISGSSSSSGNNGGQSDLSVKDPGISSLYTAWVALAPNVNNITTLQGAGEFTEFVINNLGPEWGHIKKPTAGQNRWNGHAVDAIYYKSPTPLYNGYSYQVVDIISESPSVEEPISASAKPQFFMGESPDNGERWGGKCSPC